MPPRTPQSALPRPILIVMAVYCLASLAHFVHNAENLRDYPNMPTWLSAAQVYGVWLGITAVGLAGLLLARWGLRWMALLLVAVYAALGFDGLGHYSLAPVAAHTWMMNLTIWAEVLAAAVLLALVLAHLLRPLRRRAPL